MPSATKLSPAELALQCRVRTQCIPLRDIDGMCKSCCASEFSTSRCVLANRQSLIFENVLFRQSLISNR